MKRVVIISVVLAAAGVFLSVRVPGVLASPATAPAVSADASVNAILGRACQDCHSENTAWPWYSHIPPFSGAIHKDVAAGKAQMNLSRWSQYQPAQRDEVLAEIAALVRNGLMPPPRYTVLHPRARLSDSDVHRLIEWTSAERRRLRASIDTTDQESE